MDKDPVCGMQIERAQAAAKRSYQGTSYYFCSAGCAAKFDQNPARYLVSASRNRDTAKPA